MDVFRHYLLLVLIFLQFIVLVILLLQSDVKKRDVVDIGWKINSSRNLSDYVEVEKNTAILEPKNIFDQPILLTIAVTSAPNHFDRRNAIRQTWANTSYFNFNFIEKMHANFSDTFIKVQSEKWKKYSEDVSDKVKID